MKLNKYLLYLVLLLLLIPDIVWASPEQKRILLIVSAGDSLTIVRAFKEINKLSRVNKRYLFDFITDYEILTNKADPGVLNNSDIIIADFMKREFDIFI